MSALEDLARSRMAKADDALRDGSLLLENGSWAAAINRYYYAMYYAARALLATRDRDAKTHGGLITLFHDELVRSGSFDREVARALSRVFERRQESDYSDLSEPSGPDAEASHVDAARFVAECRAFLGL